jgi:hypothetical protein
MTLIVLMEESDERRPVGPFDLNVDVAMMALPRRLQQQTQKQQASLSQEHSRQDGFKAKALRAWPFCLPRMLGCSRCALLALQGQVTL